MVSCHSDLLFYHKYYESVQPGEKDAYDLEITSHMTKDDVVEKVMEIIKNLDKSEMAQKSSTICNVI